MFENVIKEVNLRFIKPRMILPMYEKSEEYHAFYIQNQEEFVKAIWYMVKRHNLPPISYGSWEQEGAKEDFLSHEYKSYLMWSSIKEFNKEGWYIIQYDRERDALEEPLYAISVDNVKERYENFIHQFDADYQDTSSCKRIY